MGLLKVFVLDFTCLKFPINSGTSPWTLLSGNTNTSLYFLQTCPLCCSLCKEMQSPFFQLQCPYGNHGDLTNDSFGRLQSPCMDLQGLLFFSIFLRFPFPKPILEVQALVFLIKLLTNLLDSEVFQVSPF